MCVYIYILKSISLYFPIKTYYRKNYFLNINIFYLNKFPHDKIPQTFLPNAIDQIILNLTHHT